MGSEAKRLRIYEELPVIICEWHQHVLPHIHRGIASRHLPSSDLKMLHFDAHPDLTFPIKVHAADCFNKEALYYKIEIADWILPLCYEGHVNKVIWIKPQWALQISDGEYCVKIGEEKGSGGLRVNWKDVYFIEELLYSKEDSLVNAKDVEMQVQTLSSDLNNSGMCGSKQNSGENGPDKNRLRVEHESDQKVENHLFQSSIRGPLCGNYLLDIDLDFFSTHNPFKLHHLEEEFTRLTEMYKFEPPTQYSEEGIERATAQRYKQLRRLQKTILYYVQMENLAFESLECLSLIDDVTIKITEDEISRDYYDLLQRITGRQKEKGEGIDLDLIHFAGMSSELPHHKSTMDEINTALVNMENFLLKQPVPQMVTISRSTEDDYTPSDQVDYIQENVIDMLKRLYVIRNREFIRKLVRTDQPCENAANKSKSLQEILLEPDVNPCFANNDYLEDWNDDGDSDEEMDICTEVE